MRGKTLIQCFTALILAAATSVSLNAQDKVFRVSPDGSNDASGTPDAPWRTPKRAACGVQRWMSANPGKSVRLEFAPGTYFLEMTMEFSDLQGPLTIVGEGEVVFSGEKVLTGWEKSSLAGGKALVCDLKKNGVEDLGEPVSRSNRVDFYCNGSRQTLARWPNTGFTHSGNAVGATTLPDTWLHIHGTQEGVLEYTDSRIEGWKAEKDPVLSGYWYWDWADKYHRLASVDTQKRTFTVDEPYSHYGYRDSCRFYGLNLLCELDAPGEYYIDRENFLLYWIPSVEEPVETTISVFNSAYMLSAKNCSNLTLESLCFEGGRAGAVIISGGEGNKVKDCLFTRFGETAIFVAGGKGHSIEGCYLHELGCGGIAMNGGDRKSLESAEFSVSDNIVENFSLYQRTYEPAVFFHGVGLNVAHNLFRHSSSSALRLEGNEITVEYNQCFNLVEESDDQGGFDVFYDYTFRGLILRYNHWRDISGGLYAGAAGIRLDDIISGAEIRGNVFERCGGGPEGEGFGGVQINGGRDNLIYNNLFYDCRYAVSGKALTGERWLNAVLTGRGAECLEEVDALGEVYTARYPLLSKHLKEESGVNYVNCNLAVNAVSLIREDENFVHGGNGAILSTLPLEAFLEPTLMRNYGLEPIPFAKIGPLNNRWKDAVR